MCIRGGGVNFSQTIIIATLANDHVVKKHSVDYNERVSRTVMRAKIALRQSLCRERTADKTARQFS